VLGGHLHNNDAHLAAESSTPAISFGGRPPTASRTRGQAVGRVEAIDLVTLESGARASSESRMVRRTAYITALVDGVPRSTKSSTTPASSREGEPQAADSYPANKILATAYAAEDEAVSSRSGEQRSSRFAEDKVRDA